eukprot:SAG25_NODE_1000_length_4352_cov_31.202680_3_plen_77_part_00
MKTAAAAALLVRTVEEAGCAALQLPGGIAASRVVRGWLLRPAGRTTLTCDVIRRPTSSAAGPQPPALGISYEKAQK